MTKKLFQSLKAFGCYKVLCKHYISLYLNFRIYYISKSASVAQKNWAAFTKALVAGNLIFAAFEIGKILALMPFSLIKGKWYHILVHIFPFLTVIGVKYLTTESPRWFLAKSKIFEYRSIITKAALANKKDHQVRLVM